MKKIRLMVTLRNWGNLPVGSMSSAHDIAGKLRKLGEGRYKLMI